MTIIIKGQNGDVCFNPSIIRRNEAFLNRVDICGDGVCVTGIYKSATVAKNVIDEVCNRIYEKGWEDNPFVFVELPPVDYKGDK